MNVEVTGKPIKIESCYSFKYFLGGNQIIEFEHLRGITFKIKSHSYTCSQSFKNTRRESLPLQTFSGIPKHLVDAGKQESHPET